LNLDGESSLMRGLYTGRVVAIGCIGPASGMETPVESRIEAKMPSPARADERRGPSETASATRDQHHRDCLALFGN
jgi:hypothetical protein